MTSADLVSCSPSFGDALGSSCVAAEFLVEIAGRPISHRLGGELRPSRAIERPALLTTPRGDFVGIDSYGAEDDALSGECDHRVGGRLAPLLVGVVEGVTVIGQLEQPRPLAWLIPGKPDNTTGSMVPPRPWSRPEVASRE